jgi:translation elongation factor EF-Ts
LLLAQSIGKNLLNDDSITDIISEDITSAISKLGENIKLRRHIKISKKE